MNCITIQIADRNKYFAAGLRILISEYMRCRNERFLLLDGCGCSCNADVVFISMTLLIETPPYESISSLSNRCVFIIKDRHHPVGAGPVWLKLSLGVIWRWQCADSVNDLMDFFLLKKDGHNNASPQVEHYPKRLYLTPREREVLRNLALGMNNHDISHQIGISEKTVSSHKRAAMRKLNFSRNTELYYWLLNGGLKNVHISNPQ